MLYVTINNILYLLVVKGKNSNQLKEQYNE